MGDRLRRRMKTMIGTEADSLALETKTTTLLSSALHLITWNSYPNLNMLTKQAKHYLYLTTEKSPKPSQLGLHIANIRPGMLHHCSP